MSRVVLLIAAKEMRVCSARLHAVLQRPLQLPFFAVCRYYEPLITKNADKLLNVTAIVLANQCVSYIMTSQVGLLILCVFNL